MMLPDDAAPRPIEILLVEDNPGDVRLTKEALKEAKVINHLTVLKDGIEALAGKPDIIFADEPTGNLDSRSGSEILGFMSKAVDDLGQTIVMVTHDPVAAGYADNVVFLNDGRIVDEMADPTAEKVLDRMKQFGEA